MKLKFWIKHQKAIFISIRLLAGSLLLVFLSLIIWTNFQMIEVVESFSIADFKNRQVVRVATQIRPQLMKANWACTNYLQKRSDNEWSNLCYTALDAALAQVSDELNLAEFPDLKDRLDELYLLIESSKNLKTDAQLANLKKFIENSDNVFNRLGEIESDMWAQGSSRYSQLVNDFSLANKMAMTSVVLVILIFIYFLALIILKDRSDKKLSIANANIEAQRSALVHSSKMSSLGEMAAGLAHEVNNPLAVIKHNGQTLRKMGLANNFDSEKSIKAASNILQMTDRVAKIISGLRTFAREGEGDPFIETDLIAVIHETLALCYTRLKNHNIELKFNPTLASLSAEIRATQISQVLLNLVNNAHDAIENHSGEKWIEISLVDLGDFVRVEITDCGKGVPPEIQEKIFNPFFSTKEVGKGTGLGLSISMGIIKNHSGILGIDSNSKNTRFFFEIPKLLSLAKPA